MLGAQRSLLGAPKRLANFAQRTISSYQAQNEPVLGYLPGSEEKKKLDQAIEKYNNVVTDIPLVIGDEELRTGPVQQQGRPFDHQRTLSTYYLADEKQIQQAIDASQKAHMAWENTPLEKRAEIFLKAADLVSGKYRMDLMAATMLGQGKTIIQGEIDAACELADFYRYNVQYAMEVVKAQPKSTKESTNRVHYRSLEGFWAAVAPFNFTAISGNLPTAPALMGNVVLWKPPNTGVLSSYIIFKLLREAGVPAGVLNFLPSKGSHFGSVITKSPLLAGINFTGSVASFENIWKAVADNISLYKGFPRLIGECGGKNFHFIHPTGNIEHAVNGTIRSAFEYGGQKCSACARLYAPESKWDAIRDSLIEKTKTIKLGDPTEVDTFLTAVIDEKAFDRIKSFVDHAKSSPNLKILAGGTCDKSKGYFIEPTIVQTTDPKDKIMEEEIFGPILSVYVYPDKDYKQTLELIDGTSEYALTGAVYAEDKSVIEEAHDVLRYATGNFYINDKSTGSVVGQQPFGGARKSGTNDKAGGPHYMLRFVSPWTIKTTTTTLNDFNYPYMKA